VGECLPSIHEDLGSISSTTKTNKYTRYNLKAWIKDVQRCFTKEDT
jgi:hypothetical protein